MGIRTCFNHFFHFQIPCLAIVTLIALAFNIPAFCQMGGDLARVIYIAARNGDLQRVQALVNKNPELVFRFVRVCQLQHGIYSATITQMKACMMEGS
jgi:hypothetical protein